MRADRAVTAVALGFALAKLRVEWVRAPVLAKQMPSVEVRASWSSSSRKAKRGQRVTLRVASMGNLAAGGMAVPRARLDAAR